MSSLSLPLVIYLGTVAVLGMFALFRTLYWLRASTKRRKELLEARRGFDAVRTDSPVADSHRVAKERGLESIEKSFTVTRRVAIPLILTIVFGASSLPFLGALPAALVTSVAAALAVLVGIAAKPFIENVIAGLVLSSSRLINIGDTVMLDSWYGTVEDITGTHTTIKGWDWRRYIVPNSQMLQSNIINYSLFDRYVWTYVEFWVAYDADVDRVREVALAAAQESPYFAEHEQPRFWLMGMGVHGVRCWLVAWADLPSEAWLLASDIREALWKAFRREGVATHGYRSAPPGAVVVPGDGDESATVPPRENSPGA